MSSELDNYIGIVRLMLDNEKKSDEEAVDSAIKKLRTIYSISDENAEIIKRKILAVFGHHLDMGTMITDDSQEPWYMARTKDCDMICSDRNREYLLQYRGLSPDVVSKLDSITDIIMDGFGDPRKESFARRGLVMGDVQSGKTNTYTRICCKAIDVGYRMIILLTGTLESLRRQTQGRLDEGLVGKDSATFIKKKTSDMIGVGKINPNQDFAVFTHTEGDFKAVVAESLNLPITNLNIPLLLVLKKNSKIIENLATWLDSHRNGLIQSPLLLIDDEADNASINTSKDSITAINNGIRTVLSMFQRNTYVGFTATPYANIFINPDDKEDLYPEHFIYCLRSPSNYIGPRSVYQDDGNHRYMLKTIYLSNDDLETGLPELPYKHKKDFVLTKMPETMTEAINCFILSCAIRDLRGMKTSHMSMLINASRFTDVQESIKEAVEQYMFQIKAAIEVHSKLLPKEALENVYIYDLYKTWDKNYKDLEFEWEKVQYALAPATKPIVVRAVNQKNGAKTLNYDEYKTDGLRLIAVGGNSLSRGLTLEGLCVSYFYRRAQSYDTLMQMGRWFGYRDEYADLCRIWMTEESIEWYEQISVATEELKREFALMYDRKKTPRDFGLRVRSDIAGLLVTARNKMRNAGEDFVFKSLDGTPVWTSSVSVGNEKVESNERLLFNLIRRLKEEKQPIYNEVTKNYVFPNVSYKYVKDFLKEYRYPEAENILFDRDAILDMINSGSLAINWDIAIQHGIGEKYYRLSKEEGLDMYRAKRTSYSIRGDSEDNLNIRFTSAGLMSVNSMSEGIFNDYDLDNEKIQIPECDLNGSEERIKKLENDYIQALIDSGETNPPKNAPPKAYLNTSKRRPLMLLIPLQLGINFGESNPEILEKQRSLVKKLDTAAPLGVALGFPRFGEDSGDRLVIRYKTTVVYQKMGGNEDLDEEDD